MLSDRNTRSSILGPAGRGDPALCQHSFWFLEHPEMCSQDLVSFQYTLCSKFIILATGMALFFENSIIFQWRKGSSAVLCGAQEHFKTIPNRLLFAIRKLGIIRYRQQSDDVTAQFCFPYYCSDMKLSVDLKWYEVLREQWNEFYFTFKFMEGEADILNCITFKGLDVRRISNSVFCSTDTSSIRGLNILQKLARCHIFPIHQSYHPFSSNMHTTKLWGCKVSKQLAATDLERTRNFGWEKDVFRSELPWRQYLWSN